MCMVDSRRLAYGDTSGVVKILKDGKEDSMLDQFDGPVTALAAVQNYLVLCGPSKENKESTVFIFDNQTFDQIRDLNVSSLGLTKITHVSAFKEGQIALCDEKSSIAVVEYLGVG